MVETLNQIRPNQVSNLLFHPVHTVISGSVNMNTSTFSLSFSLSIADSNHKIASPVSLYTNTPAMRPRLAEHSDWSKSS